MIIKDPSNLSISTATCLATKPNIDGMEVLVMIEVAKGKACEAVDRLGQEYQEYALEIEGLKYRIETYMSVEESYKMFCMEPPEE